MPSTQKPRILLTGATGQVGFELIKCLSVLDADVVLGLRQSSSMSGLGLPSVVLDLQNPKNIQSVVNEVQPCLIINPAAFTAVDKAEEDQDSAFAINERAVAVMAESLRKIGGSLIHFSTDYVYNPPHHNPLSETDNTLPGNVYASSKLAGEIALSSADLPYLTLRTSWVYGINGNNFVKTMLRLGCVQENISVVADQHGAPTSATTLAQAVAAILAQGWEDLNGFLKERQGIYNIADRGYTTWYDFSHEIYNTARKLGINLVIQNVEPISTNEYKRPAARPLNSRLSLAKIENTFGVFTPVWQQALRVFLFQLYSCRL